MRRFERGSMLVMALWCISLLGFFAISLGFGVRQKAALLGRLTTLDALYPIAYSGVEQAKSLVQSDTNVDVDIRTDLWAASIAESQVMGGKFSLVTAAGQAVVDEESKVNLNFASVEITSRLFEQVSGLDKDEAEELVYNLTDWMDSDSFFGHPQFGAEASYYEGLDKPYTAKDLPYEVIDELLLVKGMTPPIFERVRSFVTIYGTGQVNMNTARREVLTALGFSSIGVGAIVSFRAGEDGQDGTNDDRFFSSVESIESSIANFGEAPLDVSQTTLLSGLITASKIGVKSSAFYVRSRGVLDRNNAAVEVEAYFNRKTKVLYQRVKEIQWPVKT